MLNISALLNRLHVEYSPGIVGWNKARIKRILENQHYIGDEKYPYIISLETAERANELKENRNNQKTSIRILQSIILMLTQYVRVAAPL